MMLRRTTALMLIAGLALAGVPLAAQDYAPNTVWGEAPYYASSSTNAVLLDTSGNIVATAQVLDGTFFFADVPPGQYVVMLTNATTVEVARSFAADMAVGDVVRAIFDPNQPAAAMIPASGGGGIGTTGWILIAAGVAGITTAIILVTNDDDGAASPSS